MNYPHANILNEGPNVSHRRPNYKAMLWGAAVAVIGFALWLGRTM